MAIIPNGQKFQTLTNTVDTAEKRSKRINDNQATFTMADISETVNAGGGGSLPYQSSIIKITQSGSNTPSASFLLNEIEMSISNIYNATGRITLRTPFGQLDDENTMVLVGDFHNGQSTDATTASAVHNGQDIILKTYYVDQGGAHQLTDLGFGGTESIIIEVRDFS